MRGVALYGAAVSTRIFGDLREGESPLRHVIELRADYVGVSGPTHDPVDILGFDRADDIMATSRLRFAIDQRLQTKRADARGVRRSHDVAGLLLGAELYADGGEAAKLNSGRDWGPLAGAVFVSPSPRLRLFANAEWDPNDGKLRTSETAIDFGTELGLMDDPMRTYWRASITHVSSDLPGADSSSELGARFRIYPAGRWSLELAGRYEFGERLPGWTDQSISLVRDFHDWSLAIRVWRDPGEDDFGVSLDIRPKGYPVNLSPMRP